MLYAAARGAAAAGDTGQVLPTVYAATPSFGYISIWCICDFPAGRHPQES
jgi:hypothetical protein